MFACSGKRCPNYLKWQVWYLINEMLDYLDFWCVYRPLSRGSNFHVSIKYYKWLFNLKNEVRERVLIAMLSCQKSFHESCRYRFFISFWQQCLSVKDLLSTKSFFNNISFNIFFSISQRKDFIIKHSSTWPKANVSAEKVPLTIRFIFIDFHAIGENNFSFLCRNLMNPPWDEFPFKLALHLESMEF